MLETKNIRNLTFRRERGYIEIEEDVTFDSNPTVPMLSAYSWPGLFYIGDVETAYTLWERFGICLFYNIERQDEIVDLESVDVTTKAKDSLLYGDYIANLLKRDVCSIGWSPSTKKWYGWSHRAISGFTIGSKVTKENAAFIPSDKNSFIENLLKFWELPPDGSWNVFEESGFKKKLIKYEETEHSELGPGLEVKYKTSFFGKQEGRSSYTRTSFEPFIQWGKGEWTAKTLEDAKQMAIDFAKGVS